MRAAARNTIAPLLLAAALASAGAGAQVGERARDLGIPFNGTPGANNAITDVAGVSVGYTTLIEDLPAGKAVRTGVTAILPRGRGSIDTPVFAGAFALNGNGEMTGVHWIEESGLVEGPVAITNTNSVGVVRDAIISYAAKRWPTKSNDWGWTVWSLPIVAETWDGDLNDIYGMHVKPEHLFSAIDGASGGAVAEGGVGGGTGMICYEFKGGIGTASRVLDAKQGGYTVGVLVQANFGVRHQLRVAGIPVGLEIRDGLVRSDDTGSIIIVVATDAPLLPNQVKRLARRAAMGIARTGATAGNGSGDIFLAFSTANAAAAAETEKVVPVQMLPNDRMSSLFEATVGATEEAVINALVAGRTMTGRGGNTVLGMPQDKVLAILKAHNVLVPPTGR